ncbi:hypothetical protein B0T18DRAFT_445009, partial [Schizothecium vesticola]
MTKLVAGFSSQGMQFLEVQYNVFVQPLWSSIIGCGPPPVGMTTQELTIDGPGGERITAMSWVADTVYDNLLSLELRTNRGRSLLLYENPIVSEIVSDHTAQLIPRKTRFEVGDPECVVTGLIFVDRDGSELGFRNPESFQ